MTGETFLNNNWCLLKFFKKIVKVYVGQVFVNIQRNIISSRHLSDRFWKIICSPDKVKSQSPVKNTMWLAGRGGTASTKTVPQTPLPPNWTWKNSSAPPLSNQHIPGPPFCDFFAISQAPPLEGWGVGCLPYRKPTNSGCNSFNHHVSMDLRINDTEFSLKLNSLEIILKLILIFTNKEFNDSFMRV